MQEIGRTRLRILGVSLCALLASVSSAASAEEAAMSASRSAAPAFSEATAAAAAGAPNAGPLAAAQSLALGPTSATAETDAKDKFDASSAASSDSFTSEESSGEGDTQRKLDLYGFADFTYQRLLIPSDNVWTRTYPSVNSFAVGNFNLYMSSNLGDSWRALAEVRFLYLPNGASTTDPATGNANRQNTTVLDYAGFEEPIRWGGIRIERIWLEHEFNGLLKLRVGQFLTPYGIWNVDHGSPTIIGIKKPFVVGAQLFPEQQTGLQLYGSGFLEPFEIGYYLTLSNGRGPVEYQDFNDDKAFGGRVYAKTDSIGTLTVGASFYRGGYYDRSAKYGLTPSGGVDQTYTTISKYKEMSFGADVKWEYESWLAQCEFLMNETNFAKDSRPRLQAVKPPQGFLPDYRRWGAYGLLGYRLSFLPLMPYAIIQHAYAPETPNTPPATAYELGVNYRPTAAVVVKLEYQDWHFSSAGAAGFGNYPLRILASQVAWAF
ncbi:MAG: hypothetical protein ABIQ16_21815 [Polyangiaceae bacterium]